MRIDIITVFPQMVEAVCNYSILKRAQEKGIVEFHFINPRIFTTDKHKTVDDAPYGGGAGMVMKAEPLMKAIESIPGKNKHIILLSPQGEQFNQEKAKQLSEYSHLVFVCGHYEGIDERIKKKISFSEISIGDYVVSGGELPALVLVDSIVRIIPEVLGNKESYQQDSFYEGILDYPHYTRPQRWRGLRVPKVLISGNHQKISLWRRKQALKSTFLKRQDLLKKVELSPEDKKFLKNLKERKR